MAGTADKRAGRRFGRRPALLVALGLISSLSAASALAALIAPSSGTAPDGSLSILVAPASQTVMPGTAASYSVKVARNHHGWIGLSGRTELSVRRGLPAGAGISFTSTRALAAGLTPRARTTLTITTAADMPPGTYEVQVRAQRPHRSGTAAVELTVAAPPGSGQPPTEAAPPGAPVVAPDAFTIEGTLPNLLTPGTGEPLDLTLTNLESTDLLIANLSVRVTGASGPQTDLTHACGSEDFSVEQFSGAPDFTLPASSSAQLSELGFDPTEWPTVSMLDRRVNQDGCQGASVALSFTGTATEASS